MNISEAVESLRKGGLLVFPTETVYGLGAIASNNEAVKKIFAVKGRPQENPLILHVSDLEMAKRLSEDIPDDAYKLMNAFWPGPLTICLRKSSQVSDLVSAGLPTVCLRMPAHPLAKQLIENLGEALAAPSANLSGRPSTTRFEDAKRQLQDKGVSFLDGGDTLLGLESTIVDCTKEHVVLLRPGSVTVEAIESCIGKSVQSNPSKKVTSPGQLLEHYAPKLPLTVLFGKKSARRSWMEEHFDLSNVILGLVGNPEELSVFKHMMISDDDGDLDTYAHRLYSFLNWCDTQTANAIVLELPGDTGSPLLPALINRLQKASKGNILKV